MLVVIIVLVDGTIATIHGGGGSKSWSGSSQGSVDSTGDVG